MEIVKGRTLSKTKLLKILKLFREPEKEKVCEMYWEYITDDKLPLDDKLTQVICAIPHVAEYSNEFIKASLMQGPTVQNNRLYFASKPNLAIALKKRFGSETVLKAAGNWSRQHKHCPINDNAEWALRVIISELLDLLDYQEPFKNILDFGKGITLLCRAFQVQILDRYS